MAAPSGFSASLPRTFSFENRPEVRDDYYKALPADLEQSARRLTTELAKNNLQTIPVMTTSGEQFVPGTILLRVTQENPGPEKLNIGKINSILSAIYRRDPSLENRFDVKETPGVEESFDIQPKWDI